MYEDDIESVLLTEEQVQTKVRDLAAQVSKDYAGRDVLLVGVLKGAFILMADLARHLTVPHEFDFMAVSSYGSATQTSGVVRILKDLDREIQGRDVLIVEDIIDSGLTLNYLLKNLRSRRPATLEVCALLYKPEQLKADIEVKIRRLRHPERVRGRVRAGLRRALPQPAVRGHAEARGVPRPVRRLLR